MELTEKAAYIKGLMDGLDLNETTKEGKVLRAMGELLTELAEAVEIMNDDMNDMCEDLGNIEDDLYGEDENEAEEEDEQDAYQITCPCCGAVNIVTEEELLEDDLLCANCGTAFELALEDDEDPDNQQDEDYSDDLDDDE